MPAEPIPPLQPEHLATAADRSALAAILDAQGRHREALTPLREALAVLETELGREHYEVAVTLGTLAAVTERAGDPAQATVLYERALRIQRRVLGADHVDVGQTLSRLGALHLGAQRFDAAEAAYSAAAAVFERAGRPQAADCRAARDRARTRKDG